MFVCVENAIRAIDSFELPVRVNDCIRIPDPNGVSNSANCSEFRGSQRRLMTCYPLMTGPAIIDVGQQFHTMIRIGQAYFERRTIC